jgi:hypothetical protein
VALSAKKGVLTSPGATGTQATNGVGFQPTLLFVWCAYNTAEQLVDGNAKFHLGAAAADGVTITKGYRGAFTTDAAATSSASSTLNTNGILRGFASTTTIDFVVDFTSFDSDGFTLNWTDLPATASIRVHYLALGGSDITKARVGTFTGPNNATNTDVTVTAGFGQPDLLFVLYRDSDTHVVGLGDTTADGYSSLACGVKDASGNVTQAMSTFLVDAGSPTATHALYQRTGRIGGGYDNVPPLVMEGQLTSAATWPTDGFRVNWPDTHTMNITWLYVAVRGTFQASLGTMTTATTISNVDYDAGFVPSAALMWGGNLPASTTVTETDAGAAQATAWGIGATDGTSEGGAWWADDQGNTTINAGTAHTESKAWMAVEPAVTGAPTKIGEADGLFSGNNVRLSWTDADAATRELVVLALGGGAAAAPPGLATPTFNAIPFMEGPA